MDERFGVRLRQAREALGLKQEEVVAAVGHSTAWLSRLENGNAQEPTYSEMMKLAAVLQTDPSIITGTPPPRPVQLDWQRIDQQYHDLAELAREMLTIVERGVPREAPDAPPATAPRRRREKAV